MFDKDKLNKLIVNSHYRSNKKIMIDLNNLGLPIKEDAIKKWRQGNSVPKVNVIPFLSEIFGTPEQDFFTDADKKREQITIEEITSRPDMYSKSISKAYESPMDDDLKEMIKYFQIIGKEDREKYLAEIKEKATIILNGGKL